MDLIRKLRTPTFEKTASKFILGDNPSTYPSELLAHLYKQHSYLGKYQVNMSIEGQDQSLGYMYGVFKVTQAPDMPSPAGAARMGEMIRSPEKETPQDERALRIPIIVENKKAYSFDVFISPDGRFLPLNEERVSAALFDMSPYVVAPAMSPATSAGAQNFGPQDPAAMTGGGATAVNTTVKQASVLDALGKGIDTQAVASFLEKVAGDQSLKDAVVLNEAFSAAVVKLAERMGEKEDAVEEHKSMDDFDATVVSKVGGGYKLKMASVDGVSQEIFLNNVEGQEIPVEIRQGVINNGHTLLVSAENKELVPVEKTANLKTVKADGVYSVMTKTGRAQRAAVISNLVSFDGHDMDLCLVVGESGASLQEKVAGVRCGDLNLAALSGGEPLGDGVFVLKTAAVTEPIKVLNKVEFDGETSYLYDHPLRGRGALKLASVTQPVLIKGNDYLFPDSAVFVPLAFGGRYASDTVGVDKIASSQDRMMEVCLRSDGSEFSFSGRPVAILDKTANAKLNAADALLFLGVLGDTPAGAMKKLAAATKQGAFSFVAKNSFGLPEESPTVSSEAVKLAEVIHIDLVKEAAALTNPNTVDSVLSLNFVTPENIQGYVDAIPTLEEAASKLAELLVGIRLGLSDVPESAVSSALKGIERASQGLKKLQIRADVSL